MQLRGWRGAVILWCLSVRPLRRKRARRVSLLASTVRRFPATGLRAVAVACGWQCRRNGLALSPRCQSLAAGPGQLHGTRIMAPNPDSHHPRRYPTDQALVAALVAGEAGAVEAFLAQYIPVVRGIAMNRFRCDEATARDLFQRLFLHLCEDDWRRLRMWNGTGSLAGYLRTIAVRLMTQELERRGREVTGLPEQEELWPPEATQPPHFPDLAEASDRTALLRCMRYAFGYLKPRDRQLLRRRYWKEQSYRQIAEAEQMTVNSVGVALMRAEQRLAVWMQRLCAGLLHLVRREVR